MDDLARDVAGAGAGQEQDRADDVVGSGQASERDAGDIGFDVLLEPAVCARLLAAIRRPAAEERGVDRAGCDDVGADRRPSPSRSPW